MTVNEVVENIILGESTGCNGIRVNNNVLINYFFNNDYIIVLILKNGSVIGRGEFTKDAKDKIESFIEKYV